MNALAIAHRARALVMGPFHGDISVAAAFLDVDVTQLQQTLDRRNPEPDLDALVALVDVYRLDPAWLLFGECATPDDAAPWWLIARASLRERVERLLVVQSPPPTSAQLIPSSDARASSAARGVPPAPSIDARVERFDIAADDGSRAPSRASDRGLSAVEQDVSRRLRGACGHLSPDDFTALVQQIAHVQWKYDRRKSVGSWREPRPIETPRSP